jgi:thiol-disulfide isomerase/thioredoxin
VIRRTCLLGALALLAPETARAGQATCSNPGLPVGAAASPDLLPGRVTWSLTTGLLPISDEELLQEVDGPVLYDARVNLIETRLSAELALRSWLGVGVALPFRVVTVDVTHRDPDTREPVSPPDTIHARDETIAGIGDPSLLVHLAREAGGVRFHVRAGTSVPLGRTEEDPFALGVNGLEHQHVQLGTGTFVPFVAVEAQQRAGATMFSAWALAHASLYENREGFEAGDRYSGGLAASSALGLRRWSFTAGAELHAETAERWQGVVHEEEGNAGRVDLLAGAGVSWRPVRSLAVLAELKVPIYSEVVGSQLDYPLVASFGVAGTFETRRRPSWTGLDHDVVGAPGSAPALDPVIGRITVFDLWAEWCAPCRELDEKLVALARRHPDRLAVRKLDVVDDESAAWTRYLEPGRHTLPHIKVYAEDGSFLFEQTADPDDLVRAVEQALDRM